ncbi:MAG: winged helix-turn-helix domain-containing protein [Cyclobacteriaceae bacterium]
MKSPFENLDRVLEHNVRLQIMSIVVAGETPDFSFLKDQLGVTDGNLATHIKALEKVKYLSVVKSFVDRKPNTRYKCTEKGRQAFKKHLEAMEQIIKYQRS